MDQKRAFAVGLLAIILVGIIAYVLWDYVSGGQPGAYLEGTVTIKYEDGTEIVLGSEDKRLFNILNYWNKRLNVLTYGGKKLWGISTNINLKFRVSPPDKTLKAQYWIIYWIEVDGTFFWGGRMYSGLTGFVDTPISTYQDDKAMNKWAYKVSNPELSWDHIGSFVEPFYREATSSVWVDLSTLISDPKSVTDALNGFPLVGSLADKLSAGLSATTVRDGDQPLLVKWEMSGADFYVRLKRSNFNGLSFHSGDFSIGFGEFARLWDGDQYTIKFKVGYFFRYQDITGEWTEWKHGTVTLATLDMKVTEGTWYLLTADINGGVRVDV